MDYFDFNSIKAETAEAMGRYNSQERFKKFLFFVEVFAALSLLSWSSYTYFPVAADMASEFISHHVAVLGKPLCVFISINLLIIIISVLPSQGPPKPDIYDEYVTVTNNNDPSRSFTATDQTPTAEDTVIDKQIACVDNAVKSPVEKHMVGAVTEKDCKPKHVVSPVHRKKVEAVTETTKYRRTRSEIIEGENRRELRRSETVIKRKVAATTSCEMDHLSSEEFRMTIDTFIAATRKTLIRENTLDLNLAKNQCVAITLRARN